MNPRNVLVLVLFACSAIAVIAGLWSAPAAGPGADDTISAAGASVTLIVLGITLAIIAVVLKHSESRSRREFLVLKRNLETLQLRGDFQRGQAEILEKINSLIEVFNRTRDLDAVLYRAVSALRSILNVDVIVLQLYSDEENRFFTRIEDGEHDIELGAEIQRDVVEHGRSRLVNRLESVPKYSPLLGQGYHSLLVAPLRRIQRGNVPGSVGLIAALSRTPRDFISHELNLLSTFASQAGLIIEDAHFYKKVEHLALHDGLLTEVFNRRYFIATLEEEIAKADESGLEVALIMADIDDFKQHNDTYGHLSGDAALRAAANIFLDNTRGLDVVARYGGEEFVVILPETDQNGAMTVAETIRRRIEEHEFAVRDGQLARLSISAGVAAYPSHADSAHALISAADDALYRSKALGKNRLVAAGP